MMDSRAICNFVCVLLCSVGVVVLAQDSCDTLGQVTEINRNCIDQSMKYEPFKELTLISQLGQLCRSEQDIRQCLKQNITDCNFVEQLAVQRTINDSFFLCDSQQHDVSQWAKDNFIQSSQRAVCLPDFSNPPACKQEVDKQAIGFPYENETVIGGLTALTQMKRTFFSCWKLWLSESNCTTPTAWRKNYLSFYMSVIQNTRLFGLTFDHVDKENFEEVQSGLEVEQNPMSARDIFSMFS